MLSFIFAQATPSPLDSLEKPFVDAGFDPQHFLSQVIVFSIVAFVLQKYAFGPVQKILAQRRATIEESLKNADRIKKELHEAETTRLSILQKANEQAAALVADAVKTAAAQGEIQKQQAAAQAEDIIKKAREAAILERDQLLTELKAQVANLVIATTQKVSGKVLNADDQTRLNSETTRQLAANN